MQLFLARSYHYLVAILLVEAYGILFPEYAGGVQKLNYAALGIIEQVRISADFGHALFSDTPR